MGSLDILELLLLSSFDVVLLPYGLLAEELVELASGLLGLLVVTLNLALLPVLLEETKKIEDLVVGRDVNHSVLAGMADVLLPVDAVRVVLGQSIFNLLHHFNKVIEIHEIQVGRLRLYVIILILVIDLVLLLPNLTE